MTFTMPDFRPARMEESSPWHNALQTAMANIMKMNQVKYDEPMKREALQKQQLYNKFYGPEHEASLEKARLYNQFYEPDMRSQIGLRSAQTGHLGAQTRGLNIANQSLPEKLRLELEGKRFEKENPLMGKSGPAGQIGALLYLQQHPEILQRMQSQAQNASQQSEQMPGMESGQSYIPGIMGQKNQPQTQPQTQTQAQPNTMELLQQSILNSLKPKEESHGAYAKALKDVEDTKLKYGENSEQYKNAERYANRLAAGSNEYQQKRAEAYAWASAPVSAKNYMLAQAAGMGINPDTAINEFSKGKSIEEIASKNGFDPDNLPEPDFLPNQGNITKLKERQAALKELDVLSDFVTKNMAPYSQTFLGYSPKQITDSALGKNKDKMANFLAARALSQEANLVRLTVANARGTIPAIKGISQKSLNEIKAFRSLVDEDVWKKTQTIIDSQLKKALEASAKAYTLQKNKSKISENLEKSTPDFKKMTDEELINFIG